MVNKKSHIQLSLSVLAAIAMALGATKHASAQTANVPPLVGAQNESSDPFSNRGNSQSNGIFDLIHRAMQSGSVSNDDFRTEQNDNLDSATAEFRAKQLERLRNQQRQQTTPETSTTPAATK